MEAMNAYAIPGIPDYCKKRNKTLYADKIINVVSNYFGIDVKKIKAKDRYWTQTKARQIAMYLICQETPLALHEIGSMFSNRHHTTVIHSREIVKDFLQVDPKYKVYLSDIKYLLEKN